MSAILSSVLTAALAAGSLFGAQSVASTGGWVPVEQPSFSAPAGKYCDFGFSYEPIRQNLLMRVNATYPNGDPKRVEFKGYLVGRTTNDATGKSIVRETSGRMYETFRADGSVSRIATYGKVGFGFRPEDNWRQGYFILDGKHVVTVSPDGTRTMAVDSGPEENICRSLR